MRTPQPVAVLPPGSEVLDRDRRPDHRGVVCKVVGVDDDRAGDDVLERSQPGFEHHLLLAHGVVIVVVRAVPVRTCFA